MSAEAMSWRSPQEDMPCNKPLFKPFSDLAPSASCNKKS